MHYFMAILLVVKNSCKVIQLDKKNSCKVTYWMQQQKIPLLEFLVVNTLR